MSQEEIALKPCPFCGGKAHRNGPDNPGHEYWISCMSCQASSLMRSNEEAAISAWNARALPAQGEPAAIFDECAEIALEHVGQCFAAKLSGERCNCYDGACREIADAIKLRASNRKTMDAIK